MDRTTAPSTDEHLTFSKATGGARGDTGLDLEVGGRQKPIRTPDRFLDRVTSAENAGPSTLWASRGGPPPRWSSS